MQEICIDHSLCCIFSDDWDLIIANFFKTEFGGTSIKIKNKTRTLSIII